MAVQFPRCLVFCHMGGVWERMIRTVRSVLHGICQEQILSDECLNIWGDGEPLAPKAPVSDRWSL